MTILLPRPLSTAPRQIAAHLESQISIIRDFVLALDRLRFGWLLNLDTTTPKALLELLFQVHIFSESTHQ